MVINDIKDILNRKFSLPLEEFYKRRIIIWDDPDNEFLEISKDLELINAKVVALTGVNNFYVKKLILEDDPLSNYLIYNPVRFENEESNWLLDVFEYSEHYKADYISGLLEELNATDSIMIRNTIKSYSKFFENIKRKNKFIELTKKINDIKTIHIGVLATLTNVKKMDVSEILLSIFKEGVDNENKIIKSIESFGNIDVFNELVFRVTGYQGDSIEELFNSICLTALAQTLDKGVIASYYPKYFNEEFISNCYNIVEEWYLYDNETASRLLHKVGRNVKIVNMLDGLKISDISSSDIIPHINGILLIKIFKEICNNVIKSKENIDLVNRRRTMRFYKEYKNYFEGIYYIALMQDTYSKYQNVFHMITPYELWKSYEDDLYKFDTYYRKFHYYLNLSLQRTNIYIDDSFKECAEYIENIYKNWYLNNLNSCWNKITKQEFEIAGKFNEIEHQLDFFNNYVKKSMEEKITFVIISDALRYEVGKELYEKLSKNERSKVSISSMQSIFPSITKYGMSALLPGKKIIDDEGNIFINNISTEGISNRDAILKSNDLMSIAISYEDFIKLKKEQRSDLIKGMKLVYIYHNEIDSRGHISEKQIFDSCEDTIANLCNLVSVINYLRASAKIIITADHGFLYNYKPLEESDKFTKSNIINIKECGRRYLIGTRDTNSELLTPIKLLINTRNEDFKGFAPLDSVRIKVSGQGMNYVHGGISIEELMIPVICYENIRIDSKEYTLNQDKYNNKNANIQLIGDNRRISNITFPLNFYQVDKVSNNVLETTYEIFMQDKMGKIISDTKILIANKQDEDASLRTFKIILTLKNQKYSNTDIYYLMIVEKDSGDVIDRIEYKISLIIDSDFDFLGGN